MPSKNESIIKKGVLVLTALFVWRFCCSLGTSQKELIWCNKYQDAQIRTFCKRWSFIWRYFFSVSILKPFLKKLYTPKVIVQILPKRNLFVILPFLGSNSFQIRKKVQKLFIDKLMSCNLEIVSMSAVKD